MNNFRSKVIAILAVVIIAGGGYIMGTNLTFGSRAVSAAPVLYNQDVVTSIYDAASPAIFEIDIAQPGNGLFGQVRGQGSGFLIDNQGYILTNNHVIEGASTVKVVLEGGNRVDARVVGTDAADDLALLKVEPAAVAGITPLELADSSTVKPGQLAIAIGSPYGLDDTVTVGVVSGLNRRLGGGRSSLTGMIQTDATLNPGNSGGPLLNDEGQVIGINTAIESASGARGIGFAVPSNVASRALPALRAGQQITRPWLGISGAALNAENAQALGLSVNKGVYIVTVLPNSPASKAGLKGSGSSASGDLAPPGGDVIIAADGKTVGSVEELSAYFNTKQVGSTVSLSVLRGGQTLTIQVTLEAWPANLSPVNPVPVPQPSLPSPWRMPEGWRD